MGQSSHVYNIRRVRSKGTCTGLGHSRREREGGAAGKYGAGHGPSGTLRVARRGPGVVDWAVVLLGGEGSGEHAMAELERTGPRCPVPLDLPCAGDGRLPLQR